jgi:hypothetical protein
LQVDDLVLLDSISEGKIVEALQNRYAQDLIYTNIASVLIAVRRTRHSQPFPRSLACCCRSQLQRLRPLCTVRCTLSQPKLHTLSLFVPSAHSLCCSCAVCSVLGQINPFKMISSNYTDAKIREYKGKKHYELSPHVFALADEAYSNMISYRENQCVIISGESGSVGQRQIGCSRMLAAAFTRVLSTHA